MSVPEDVSTPRVLIDRDVLERNITRMAAHVRGKGLRLRPHAKTHKVLEIADRQLAAGAAGLTVATIGEAEVFAEHGVDDLFIAYPLWLTRPQAERLRRLSARARVSVGVDSVEGAQTIGAASKGAASNGAGEIAVLVEIDSGHHRSGIHPGLVVEVAQAADRAGLRVEGVFTFPGHSYAPGMPQQAVEQEQAALAEAAELLVAAGFDVSRRSGGSTPTATLTGPSVVTEVRPGVYVFGDGQQLELERCSWDDIALTVAATVVSRHDTGHGSPRRVVLDSGSKVLGTDRAAWATGHGRVIGHPEARITGLSEHHATVVWPEESPLPVLGERLRVVPNHVCITMNLVDDVAVVSQGQLVDQWAVAARGKNS